jgi:hypothetical protein
MFESIKKLTKDALTENDNQTFEIGRILWAAAVVIGLMLETISVFTSFKFDLQAYGIGVGALLGSGGVIVALKAKVESVAQ